MDSAGRAYIKQVAHSVYEQALDFERAGDRDLATCILESVEPWLMEVVEELFADETRSATRRAPVRNV